MPLPSVLLIDDESKFRKYFCEYFQEEVARNLIEIETAGDAMEGLNIIEEKQKKQIPTYVVFDIILPVSSGLELIEKINLKSKHPSGCVISAHIQLSELKQIINKYDWLNACFHKPLKIEMLRRRIQEFAEQSSITKFDYGVSDQDTALLLRQETEKIQSIMKRTVRDIIEIGESLQKIKSKLDYGQFYLWIEEQLSLDPSTASHFMRVADVFGDRKEEVAELGLGISVLYVLASRNSPEDFRDEIFKRAKAGIKPSFSETKQLKKEFLERDQIQQQKEDTVTIDVNSSVDGEEVPVLEKSPTKLTKNPKTQSKIKAKAQEIIKLVGEQKVWNLGNHILYCGFSNSPEFKNLLKSSTVSFNIGFPNFTNWTQEDLFPVLTESTLIYSTLSSYDNPEKNRVVFFDMLKKSIQFSTPEKSKIVISYCPYPEIILLIEKLNSQAFIAEPDPQKCQAIISVWEQHNS